MEIVLCDTHRHRLQEYEKLLEQRLIVHSFTSPADTLLLLQAREFAGVLLHKEIGVEFAALCRRYFPQLFIGVVGDSWSEDDLERYKAAEVDAVYDKLDAHEVEELYQLIKEHLYLNGSDVMEPGKQEAKVCRPCASTQQFQQIKQKAQEPSDRAITDRGSKKMSWMPYEKAQVVSFYSPKGGVGKTTLAVNTAVALARAGHGVCLVDLDIFFGNVASVLSLREGYQSVLDWVDVAGELNQERIEKMLVRHPSGLWVLPAPAESADECQITAEVANTIISNLQTIFDIVLLDLGPVYRDSNLVAFDMSDRIFMITDLDRTTLKDCLDIKRDFGLLRVPTDKISVLVNMVTGKEQIPLSYVKKELPYEVVTMLPYEIDMKRILNDGDLIIDKQPKSGFSRAIQTLLITQFGIGDQPKNSGGFWQKLFGKGAAL